MSKELVRTMVRGTYGIQKLRIQTGNRIVANWKVKLGQAPGESEEDSLSPEAKEILEVLRLSWSRITDGIATDNPTPKKIAKDFEGDGTISTFTEYALVAQYLELVKQEEDHVKRLVVILDDFPIWTQFLKGVKGIKERLAGVLISEIDITRAKYPSSLWKYAGLDVAGDGRGRSKRKEHLVEVTYTNANGEQATRNSITYNPFLKSKLMGVLAGSFLKSKSPYAKLYYDYKHRLETDTVTKVVRVEDGEVVHTSSDKAATERWAMEGHFAHYETKMTGRGKAKKEEAVVVLNEGYEFRCRQDWPKGRRHKAAMRYMVKMFLIDLHREWRTLEGLPVATPYSEGKLGMVHGEAA